MICTAAEGPSDSTAPFQVSVDEHELLVIGTSVIRPLPFRGRLHLTIAVASSRRGRRHARPCSAGSPHPDRESSLVPPRAQSEERPSHAQLARTIMQATAQRYSGLLYTTGHRTGDSFYLRSQMNTDCLGQCCLFSSLSISSSLTPPVSSQAFRSRILTHKRVSSFVSATSVMTSVPTFRPRSTGTIRPPEPVPIWTQVSLCPAKQQSTPIGSY